jgi:hypothetical protein
MTIQSLFQTVSKYQNNWKLEIIGSIYDNPDLLKSTDLQEAA